MTRRTFVSASAVAAPALLSAQSAGTKVNVGWVGLGNRGGKHIRVTANQLRVKTTIMWRLIKVSLGGIGQFVIATSSWIGLERRVVDAPHGLVPVTTRT